MNMVVPRPVEHGAAPRYFLFSPLSSYCCFLFPFIVDSGAGH